MCGIVGYVGRSEAAPILLDGLKRLEYRGYDSAGVAIVNGNHLETRKCAGRIASLAKLISQKPAAGSLGISHTRWATHGKVTDENAHPHFDATGKIALVHNGVIENYQQLKQQLIQDGDTNFRSDTDTEVLAHLIGRIYQQNDGQDSKARHEFPLEHRQGSARALDWQNLSAERRPRFQGATGQCRARGILAVVLLINPA